MNNLFLLNAFTDTYSFMNPICLWSIKWSHLIINTEKYQQRLTDHPATEDWFIHVVWWIVQDSDGKIYLHHNAKLNEFVLPWGKVERWESFEDALTRELREELSIEVKQSHHISSIKYIHWWQKRCFHMFIIDEYTWIPLNNDSHKLDQYRAEIIDSDNDLWYAIKIDGTITDDGQDIMQSFIDIYHWKTIIPQLRDNILVNSTYVDYDQDEIDPSKHYYLYLDQKKKEYYVDHKIS
jgi:8-oxo-dGTP pyrophosphatase MutT (NUDIX family)